MTEVKAPNRFRRIRRIFLAGSIEQGMAENWQKKVVEGLAGLDIEILNPRRDHWDPTWDQSIQNKEFEEQVNWELDAMEHADIIVMWFAPGTKSPTTMLELGLFARSNKLFVGCPPEFWRSGNVGIVCQRYGITPFLDLDQCIKLLRIAIKNDSVGEK